MLKDAAACPLAPNQLLGDVLWVLMWLYTSYTCACGLGVIHECFLRWRWSQVEKHLTSIHQNTFFKMTVSESVCPLCCWIGWFLTGALMVATLPLHLCSYLFLSCIYASPHFHDPWSFFEFLWELAKMLLTLAQCLLYKTTFIIAASRENMFTYVAAYVA